MSDEGTSYSIRIDDETTGLDDALGKLERTEKVIDKADASLGKLSTSMKHGAEASEKMGHAHGKHASELKGLEGAFDRLVHAGMDPFLHKAKEIAEFEFIRRGVDELLEAPEMMAEKVKELGSEMIKAAAHAERMDAAMGLLFGKKGAEEHSEYINRIRKVLPFSKQTIEDAGLDLARVGFEREGKDGKDSPLSKALAAAADMASFAPNKESGFFEALSTLEKVKRTGDVEERALGALGLGKNDFLKELSRETGKDIATLKSQLSEGKADVEASLNSLYNLLLKKTGKSELGATALEMGKLLDARLTRLHDLPDVYMDKLGDSEAKTRFSGFVDKVATMLDPDTDKGKKIFESIEKSALSLVKTLEKIDLGHELEVGVAVLEKLPRLIDLSTKALEAFGFAAQAAAGPLLPVLGAAALATPAERKEMGSVANEMIFGKSSAELNKMSTLDRLGVGVKGALKTVGGMFSYPFRDHSAGEGAADGMKSDKPLVHDAAEALGHAALDGTRDAIEAHSPSRKFAELGRFSARGYAEGIEESLGQVDDSMRAMFRVPAPPYTPMATAFNPRSIPTAAPVVNITVDVSGANLHTPASVEEVGEIVAAKIERVLPGALINALDGIGLQGGTT